MESFCQKYLECAPFSQDFFIAIGIFLVAILIIVVLGYFFLSKLRDIFSMFLPIAGGALSWIICDVFCSSLSDYKQIIVFCGIILGIIIGSLVSSKRTKYFISLIIFYGGLFFVGKIFQSKFPEIYDSAAGFTKKEFEKSSQITKDISE